jgi:hypothetical protein
MLRSSRTPGSRCSCTVRGWCGAPGPCRSDPHRPERVGAARSWRGRACRGTCCDPHRPQRVGAALSYEEIVPTAGVVAILTGPPGPVLRPCTALQFFISALKAVAPEFPGLPDDPPPLEFQVADPDVLRERLTDAGLKEVRVERTAERPAFTSGQEMWDWVLYGNPIPGMLLADLREDQQTRLREILDGMLRERFGTNGRAVLTNAVNIGIGTKWSPRSRTIEPLGTARTRGLR